MTVSLCERIEESRGKSQDFEIERATTWKNLDIKKWTLNVTFNIQRPFGALNPSENYKIWLEIKNSNIEKSLVIVC